MSSRKRLKKPAPIQEHTDFTVLDGDALDRMDQACEFCGQRIHWREAPEAVDWTEDHGRRFAHGVCAWQMQFVS